MYNVYITYFEDGQQTECLLQEEHMDEESREAFLARFQAAEKKIYAAERVFGHWGRIWS